MTKCTSMTNMDSVLANINLTLYKVTNCYPTYWNCFKERECGVSWYTKHLTKDCLFFVTSQCSAPVTTAWTSKRHSTSTLVYRKSRKPCYAMYSFLPTEDINSKKKCHLDDVCCNQIRSRDPKQQTIHSLID